jgi:hypothetical protein
MKTAILFTGLPRTLELGYLFHKNYLIEPRKADVFIHTWDIDNGGYRFALEGNTINTGRVVSPTSEIAPPCFNKSIKNFIIDDMRCKGYSIESYSEFSKKNGNGSDAAQTYSWKRSNELKKEYERKNNFRYDIVIKTRCDILPCSNISEEEINDCQDKIYIGQNYNEKHYRRRDFTHPDGFAFSSSELMDIYCECFDTWSTGVPHKSEDLLRHHFEINKLSHKLTSLKMKMMEVYTENEWYAVYHTH